MNFLDEQMKNSSLRVIDNETVSLLFDNQTVRYKVEEEESFFSQYLKTDDLVQIKYSVSAFDDEIASLWQYLQAYYFASDYSSLIAQVLEVKVENSTGTYYLIQNQTV